MSSKREVSTKIEQEIETYRTIVRITPVGFDSPVIRVRKETDVTTMAWRPATVEFSSLHGLSADEAHEFQVGLQHAINLAQMLDEQHTGMFDPDGNLATG